MNKRQHLKAAEDLAERLMASTREALQKARACDLRTSEELAEAAHFAKTLAEFVSGLAAGELEHSAGELRNRCGFAGELLFTLTGTLQTLADDLYFDPEVGKEDSEPVPAPRTQVPVRIVHPQVFNLNDPAGFRNSLDVLPVTPEDGISEDLRYDPEVSKVLDLVEPAFIVKEDPEPVPAPRTQVPGFLRPEARLLFAGAPWPEDGVPVEEHQLPAFLRPQAGLSQVTPRGPGDDAA